MTLRKLTILRGYFKYKYWILHLNVSNEILAEFLKNLSIFDCSKNAKKALTVKFSIEFLSNFVTHV